MEKGRIKISIKLMVSIIEFIIVIEWNSPLQKTELEFPTGTANSFQKCYKIDVCPAVREARVYLLRPRPLQCMSSSVLPAVNKSPYFKYLPYKCTYNFLPFVQVHC